jgi:DNA invertase Pin-like site-specific DNA recombinase
MGVYMGSVKFGYVRVSTQEQKTDRQLAAMRELEIAPENLYTDKQSGKNFERPAYKRMLRHLQKGDILYVKSIDRLGRNYADIIEQWRALTREKSIDIIILDMPLLDTTYCKDLLGTFISDLVLQVMSFSAQIERENILQRQAEGIAAAKARGVVFGKEPLSMPENFDEIYSKWRVGELSDAQTAELCGFSRRTLYSKTKEQRLADYSSANGFASGARAAKPAQTAKSAQTARAARAAKAAKAAKASRAVQSGQATKAAKAARAGQAAQFAQAGQAEHAAQAAQSGQAAHAGQPAPGL